jgi:hypothetical protein
MKDSDGLFAAVGQDDGVAIRHLDADEHAARVGDEAVSGGGENDAAADVAQGEARVFRRVRAPDAVDDSGVHLVEQDERKAFAGWGGGLRLLD